MVPFHINDIKNIFVTANRSLAKVGYGLSKSIAISKEYFIPLVMTDITWGTLIWFNSPATISSINRPRLVSAAYAAFRPSPELIKKLNTSLSKLEKEGKITPEQCYFLKVSPIAQQLLAKKTVNDPNKFVELAPLEILKSLESNAYDQGSLSRQKEIDALNERVAKSDFQLAIEKQKNVIADCEKSYEIAKNKVSDLKRRKESLENTLDDQKNVGAHIDIIVDKKIRKIKIAITIVATILAIGAIYVGYKWSWIIGIISFVISILMFTVALWKGQSISLLSLIPRIEKSIRTKQNLLRRFSPEYLSECEQELSQVSQELSLAERELSQATANLNREKMKLDQYSVDISILQK